MNVRKTTLSSLHRVRNEIYHWNEIKYCQCLHLSLNAYSNDLSRGKQNPAMESISLRFFHNPLLMTVKLVYFLQGPTMYQRSELKIVFPLLLLDLWVNLTVSYVIPDGIS